MNPKWHALIDHLKHFENARCEIYKHDKDLARHESDRSASTDRLILGLLDDMHFPTNPSTCRYLLRRVIGDTAEEAPAPEPGALVQTFVYSYNGHDSPSLTGDNSMQTIQLLVSEGQWANADIQRDAVKMMTAHRKWLSKISLLKIPGDRYSNSGRTDRSVDDDSFLARLKKNRKVEKERSAELSSAVQHLCEYFHGGVLVERTSRGYVFTSPFLSFAWGSWTFNSAVPSDGQI